MENKNGENENVIDKKKIAVLIAETIVVAILAVTSFYLLPDVVTVQLSIGGASANTMPKIVAVLLPTALSVLGGGLQCFGEQKNKGVVVYIIGLAVFGIMLAVNL